MAIGGAEFAEDVAEMEVHGAFGHAKPRRDIQACLPVRGEGQALDLSRAQSLPLLQRRRIGVNKMGHEEFMEV